MFHCIMTTTKKKNKINIQLYNNKKHIIFKPIYSLGLESKSDIAYLRIMFYFIILLSKVISLTDS